MALPVDPKQWRIGLVGYGEVGRILAEDLHELGVVKLVAHDVKLAVAGAAASEMRAHAAKHGVKLSDSHRALANDCELIVSAVTANQSAMAPTMAASAAARTKPTHAPTPST